MLRYASLETENIEMDRSILEEIADARQRQ